MNEKKPLLDFSNPAVYAGVWLVVLVIMGIVQCIVMSR